MEKGNLLLFVGENSDKWIKNTVFVSKLISIELKSKIILFIVF